MLPDDGGTLALDLYLDAARVPELVVAPDAAGGTVIEVESALGRLHLLREPIAIRGLSADIRLAGGQLEGTLNRVALPQGTVQGTVEVFFDPDASRRVALELEVEDLSGQELAGLVPATPPFTGSTRLSGVVDRDGATRWTVNGLDARWDGGRIQGGGGFRTRGGVTLEAMDLRVEGLPVSALARYAPVAADKPGILSGNLRLDGPLERLGVVGRVGHRSSAGALSTADVSGVVVRDPGRISLSETEIFFTSLDYPSLEPWIPGLPVAGAGTARIRLNGHPTQGLRLEMDLTQRGSLGGVSRVVAQGSVRQDGERWRVDVQGDASPFQLPALRDRYPDLPVQGAVSGSFRVNGVSDSLALRLEVEGAQGRLALQGVLDPTDLTRAARVEGTAEAFQLGAFLIPAGERTRLTGELRAEGAGRGAEMQGEGFLRLTGSNLRGVPVDSVLIRSVVRDGALVLDTARASVGGFELDGGGRLALPGTDGPRGTMALSFRSDSLMGLRPAFLGDVVHARDTLQDLDREILLLSGIDPDTLPLLSEVTLQGTVEGHIALEGALDDFHGSARVVMDRLSYGEAFLEAATLELEGRSLPGEAAVVQLSLDTDSVRALDRELASTRIRASLTRTGARASV
ncbi:MAG TPA: hypothetical protein VLA43_17495, partial [Longimicrobiales bacterium]|nr:hypothetical protein [Longimicrobiales bacterium]